MDVGAQGITDMALPPILHNKKNNPFPINAEHLDGSKEEYPKDATIPRDNSSPADTPTHPLKASPAPPMDVGARGIIGMALPPTLQNNKSHPFPIDAALLDGSKEEYKNYTQQSNSALEGGGWRQ